jgi:hypothetical protein
MPSIYKLKAYTFCLIFFLSILLSGGNLPYTEINAFEFFDRDGLWGLFVFLLVLAFLFLFSVCYVTLHIITISGFLGLLIRDKALFSAFFYGLFFCLPFLALPIVDVINFINGEKEIQESVSGLLYLIWLGFLLIFDGLWIKVHDSLRETGGGGSSIELSDGD